MKICYLVNVEDIHAQRWIKYFKDRGHEIFVITSQLPNELDIRQYRLKWGIPIGSKYSYSPFRHVFSPYSIYQIKKILKNEKPDIVHTYYASHYGFIAALVNYHPLLLSALGSDILLNPRSKILKYMVKFALKKANLITCDGSNLKEALIELGTEPKKIYRIYWGTDTREFNPGERSEKLRKEWEIVDSPMIISSKNLEPVYDIESLVRSIPLVFKKVPEAKFVIAGKGSQEAELKQLAKSLGVSDSVRFVGLIPSDEFPKYLASADVYVCTSLSDGGLAVSTKEAMACELPVIVTDFGDTGKWIENGANGFVIPLRDPKTLAEKIIYLIEHEDVRLKFGEKGRKMVKERFEYDKELKKVENLYEQLIREHKK